MFFMTKADLAYLGQSAGWELGVGPSVVAVDAGMAKTLTTTTARAGIYAFIFGQRVPPLHTRRHSFFCCTRPERGL